MKRVKPKNTRGRKLIDDGKPEKSWWKKTEVALVDRHFNVRAVSPERESAIRRFGEHFDDRRLYVVNEVCVQAIGAGDMTVTFFSVDPTVYGYEQTTI